MSQYKVIFKVMRILMILFMVFGVVFTVIVALKGEASLEVDSSLLNPYFRGTYILLLGTLAFAILFPIFGFFTDIKKGVRFLVALVITAALFGLSYLLASGSIEGAVYEKFNVTQATSRLVESGLIMTYILAVLAVLAVTASSVISIFKR